MLTTSPNLRLKDTVGALTLIRHEHILLKGWGHRKHGTLTEIFLRAWLGKCIGVQSF